MQVYCIECEAANAEDAASCTQCGHPLRERQKDEVRFTAACPKCHRTITVEAFEHQMRRGSGLIVTCDHCGHTKRLAGFQREQRR